jgi:DNA repair photolyase
MPSAIRISSILNKTKKRDKWFLDEYTINPYSGCSFNCLYCYTRGSRYGENLEDKVSVKENAVELLHKQLAARSRKNQYGIIVLSSATDPYLQFEKETGLTRKLLEVILHYRFPVHIITKSDLVLRDLDLLIRINSNAILPGDLEQKLPARAFVTFSFSSIDPHICRIFEPGATGPEKRLETLSLVSKAGLVSGVSLMPILPYISDNGSQLESMFHTFKQAGAQYIFPSTITFFGNDHSDSKTLMLRAVEKHYPHLLDKYKRFFTYSHTMPEFYSQAFNRKMKELSAKYGLRNSLASPA